MGRVKKRCNACGLKKSWEDFYAKVKWEDGSMRQPHSRCKACMKIAKAAWFRALPKRKRSAHYKAKFKALQADPERHATRKAYERDWHHRHSSNPTPSRWIDGPTRSDHDGRVSTTVLREVVERSGVPTTTISLAAGFTESTVYKALQRDTMSAVMAVRVLHALDVLPAEVGL